MILGVDTSAIVALILGEPAASWVQFRLETAEARLISAASMVELGVVLEARRRPFAVAEVASSLDLAIVDVTPWHAEVAVDAFRRFGKGRHRAGLNLGDCFSYALASVAMVPLLCLGDDFTQTDLQVLTPPPPTNP